MTLITQNPLASRRITEWGKWYHLLPSCNFWSSQDLVSSYKVSTSWIWQSWPSLSSWLDSKSLLPKFCLRQNSIRTFLVVHFAEKRHLTKIRNPWLHLWRSQRIIQKCFSKFSTMNFLNGLFGGKEALGTAVAIFFWCFQWNTYKHILKF